MPPDHRRIQRYFHPLSSRARFSPERVLISPTRSTRYTVFGPDNGNPRRPASSHIGPTDIFEDNAPALFRLPTDDLVSKPNGEVTRISRDGYNLRDQLGWKPDFYSEVQVQFPF
jgi:hypothetical protein